MCYADLMGAKVAVPVEDYLRMTFDGPDREYVDGEIVERAVGDNPHSAMQARLIEIFYELRKLHPLYARPELRHRVRPTRYRIPDVAVFAGHPPAENVPSSPPYIAIEIVSPDDRHTDIMQKLDEYRTWGVPHVWLVDPRLRKLTVCDSAGLRDVPAFPLPEYGLEISASQVFESL